jgi:hypothetical protein
MKGICQAKILELRSLIRPHRLMSECSFVYSAADREMGHHPGGRYNPGPKLSVLVFIKDLPGNKGC